jgi:hypothetical protein
MKSLGMSASGAWQQHLACPNILDRGWLIIPIISKSSSSSLHGAVTLLGFCRRYGVHYRLLSTCVGYFTCHVAWTLVQGTMVFSSPEGPWWIQKKHMTIIFHLMLSSQFSTPRYMYFKTSKISSCATRIQRWYLTSVGCQPGMSYNCIRYACHHPGPADYPWC